MSATFGSIWLAPLDWCILNSMSTIIKGNNQNMIHEMAKWHDPLRK